MYHKCEYEELQRQPDLGPILDSATNLQHDLEQYTCCPCSVPSKGSKDHDYVFTHPFLAL